MNLPETRAEIARLVPHQGGMCLLEAVHRCDAEAIGCTTGTHRDPANPLRRDGTLPAVCGVEYGLQAMALHGALTAGAAQPAGFVAALAGVEFTVTRLDDLPGVLDITATALSRESRGFIYAFAVAGGGRVLVAGRATVVLP
ncbi:phosphotransferase [Roseomonas fluvialis]|uniref:Phosphotransferase n=1 Tax=Roseomonas fluvialis TaxID=1750527 RepID=A0ABM7XYJ0_9PROT|nr:phosphotransferase [Roseomonas fluvialis]BDG70570.1 phosphotransferase [Roseomonas fluvialis]